MRNTANKGAFRRIYEAEPEEHWQEHPSSGLQSSQKRDQGESFEPILVSQWLDETLDKAAKRREIELS